MAAQKKGGKMRVKPENKKTESGVRQGWQGGEECPLQREYFEEERSVSLS